MIYPVFSLDDVAYGINETAGCIVSASEYGRYIYANALENALSNTASCEENIYHVLGTSSDLRDSEVLSRS